MSWKREREREKFSNDHSAWLVQINEEWEKRVKVSEWIHLCSHTGNSIVMIVMLLTHPTYSSFILFCRIYFPAIYCFPSSYSSKVSLICHWIFGSWVLSFIWFYFYWLRLVNYCCYYSVAIAMVNLSSLHERLHWLIAHWYSVTRESYLVTSLDLFAVEWQRKAKYIHLLACTLQG